MEPRDTAPGAHRAFVCALAFLLAPLAAFGAEPPPAPAEAVAPPEEPGEAPPAREPSETKAPAEDQKKPKTLPRLVEHVVVRATRAEDRRDAATFTNVTREEIESRDRGQDLAMILADTPNAYAYSDAGNGIGYSYLSLRGFRQERIATYVDGVPLNTPEDHALYFIDLADLAGGLAGVQVQRGTGTALYGSPAVGGVVHLEMGHLDAVEGGQLKIAAGSFGTRRLDFRYGGPSASGRWAWMARVAHVDSDGYRVPSWTRHTLLQFALERFGADHVLRIHLFGGPERTQLAYYGITSACLRGDVAAVPDWDPCYGKMSGDPDHDRRINPMRSGETDTFLQPHLHVLHDWEISDRLFLHNAAYLVVNDGYFMQYNDRFGNYVTSWDSGGEPLAVTPVQDSWRKRWIGGQDIGWVPRLSLDHAGGTLTAGLFVQHHEMHHRGTLREGLLCTSPDPNDPCAATVPLDGPKALYDYVNRKESFSAFARETIRPSPRLAVHLELQATQHRFSMGDDRIRALSWETRYSFLAPRLGVNWNPSDRLGLYASVSEADSEPSFDSVWDPQDPFAPALRAFRGYDAGRRRYSDALARPESLRDYEIGVVYRTGATLLKASAYRMDFRDEFVPQGGLDEDGLPITINAGRSLHRGLELEAAGKLPGDIDAGAYLAVSRDILEDFTLYGTGASGESVRVDYSGNAIAGFPSHIARVRLARQFGQARVLVGARRIGTIYLDNSEDERKDPAARLSEGYVPKRIGPYTVVDAQASLDLTRLVARRGASLRLDLWVDNLLDRRYVAMGYSYPDAGFSAFYTEFFPGATRNFLAGLTYGF